jgi:hypothetical protein
MSRVQAVLVMQVTPANRGVPEGEVQVLGLKIRVTKVKVFL